MDQGFYVTNPYGTGPKGRATEYHAKITRAKGFCENCNATNVRLECAHIIGRRNSQVRTDLENCFCLCHNCHQWFTDHPPQFAQFIFDQRGEAWYWALYERSLSTAKVDWVERAAYLKQIWKQLELAA